MTCPVCDSLDAVPVEQRARTPVMMNKLHASRAAARNAPCGTLDLVLCAACGFLWNRAFDPDLVAYDDLYENDQTGSPAFLEHVRARAADVVAAAPLGEMIDFLEIGCGQGGFIGTLAGVAGGRLRSAEGFDPAWRGADGLGPAGSRIHKVYFDQTSAARLARRPNVVATRHTIEHVPRPIAFLSTIRSALGPGSRARLLVETPAVEWILRHQAMQDLFYEHCSIFSAQALRFALERSGFRTLRIDAVFGEQYLWAEAEACDGIAPRPPDRTALRHVLQNLADAPRRFVNHWRTAVAEARSRGLVAIWGAGAKGVTFSALIDPEGTSIDHVIDINPAKQGLHVAGSGLPVLAPETSGQRNPSTIIVMNPNYIEEIREQARRAGITARLVPLE